MCEETETEDEDDDDRQDKQYNENGGDVDEKRNSLNAKLAVLEFNFISALTLHETPGIMPTLVQSQ